MYQNLLNQSSLYWILRRLDEELAADAKKLGCPYCGGQLHRANYPRKPRGAPAEVERDPSYRRRLSFCCAEEGCRRRRTPASVRFLGRKVYLGAVVVLVSVLRQGPSPTRLAKLKELVGVSARTVGRWRKWWLKDFVESAFWKAARGHLREPLEESQLPRSLLEAFQASSPLLRLVDFLRFVKPLTIPSPAAGQEF